MRNRDSVGDGPLLVGGAVREGDLVGRRRNVDVKFLSRCQEST